MSLVIRLLKGYYKSDDNSEEDFEERIRKDIEGFKKQTNVANPSITELEDALKLCTRITK
jgi:hypothetical protein